MGQICQNLPGAGTATVRDSLSPCTGSVCVLQGCRWQGAQAIQRGGGAEWQQQRVKGSTPRWQLRPARVSVQIIVYSGKGARAQAHAGHEPQTLRGLAQGQHQRGLLWQVLRFCGGKQRAAQKGCSGSPVLRPLSVPAGHQAQIPSRRCWLWKEAVPKYCQLCAAAAPHAPPPMNHPTAQQGL